MLSFLCVLKLVSMLPRAFAAINGFTTIINASGWGDLATVELNELHVSKWLFTDDTSFQRTALDVTMHVHRGSSTKI